MSNVHLLKTAKLNEAEKTGLLPLLRQSHPRIYTHDWQAVLKKVDTDENTKAWYAAILAAADEQLESAPVEYHVNFRNNINESSTIFKNNVIPVAAAYCLTGDVRYKNRVWTELENVGNWPGWGANAYLCTAHILLAFALCYDWLYNDWTEDERKQIVTWILEKGLCEAVWAYENPHESKGHWAIGENNWNNVCNGSNFVAAIAIADEAPDVADYIFKKASDGLVYSFQEISADGAYAEPIVYWDYGVRHQVKVMAALDTCIKDGATLPACLDYKDVRGLNCTGDYPIYYNGTTGAFNYGDGTTNLIITPIMYYLANKYQKPQYAWYNLNMEKRHAGAPDKAGKNATLSLLWYDADNTKYPEGGFALDKFYQSREKFGTNGISMRASWEDQNGMVVMAHAGDQTMGHSNLDAGGFVLDWANKRWFHLYGRRPGGIDAGVVYSWPGFFQKTETGRYTYYHARGEASNTIIANPKKDLPDMNITYFAALDSFGSGKDSAYGIIDMTDTNKDYEDAKRGFLLADNRSRLVIRDEIEAKMPSEFYWFANTLADIDIAEDGKSATLTMGEDKLLVRITDAPAAARITAMETKPLPTSPNPEIQVKINEQKLCIHVKDVQSLRLSVEFLPLTDKPALDALPLAQWKDTLK